LTDNFSKNYFKIYLWQFISIGLNFISMFIVIPYLTSNPAIYGIYTVCISISSFLVYADLGFVSAGQKYASEYFAQGKREDEVHLIGFTSFILLFFLILMALVFFYLSYNPALLIKKLEAENEWAIASNLLLILAIFTPVTMLQRLCQIIFAIRLEDYIVQRINILANLGKILSVLYFFRNDNYEIVGYFLFTQVLNLFAILTALFIARKKYNYDLLTLFSSIKFHPEIFDKTKGLAFTSLFSLFSWILYYELDPAAIGKWIGAKEVAIFAIGLTLMSFFRSILGTIFSPFSVRFNHFIGTQNHDGLKGLCFTITKVTAPLIILPIVTLILITPSLISSWVGTQYAASIVPAKFLIACNIFAFISYPGSLLLMAQERIKLMYIVNALLPIIYWGGILLTYSSFGLNSFAFFKFIAFSISSSTYAWVLIKFFGLSLIDLFENYVKPIILPMLFLFLSYYLLAQRLPMEKSKINLLLVGSYAFLMLMTSFLVLYFSSSQFKGQIFTLLEIVKNK
jgi:O-antigen/teichoic acid export membrane protein